MLHELNTGNYHMKLGERDMSMILDALDIAVAATAAADHAGLEPPISVFEVDDFAELRNRFERRFQF